MTYCDSWLDAPYAPVVEAFHASGRPALMCVFRNENRWDASNVHFENGVIRRYSKKLRLPEMQHIDWGLAMLKASAVATPPDGKALGSGRTLRRVVDFRRPRRLRDDPPILRNRFLRGTYRNKPTYVHGLIALADPLLLAVAKAEKLDCGGLERVLLDSEKSGRTDGNTE